MSIAKHLDYSEVIRSVFGTFDSFSKDEVWGVRKVCLEHLPSVVSLLDKTELAKIEDIV